jgi:hypothetical protein
MRAMKTAFVLAAFAATSALADCPAPEGTVQIPNGAAATRDEMVAAQKAVKAYDNAVRAYSACLDQEQHAKVSLGADRGALADEYSRRSEAEVDKLEKLADKFNAELRAFKARNAS